MIDGMIIVIGIWVDGYHYDHASGDVGDHDFYHDDKYDCYH